MITRRILLAGAGGVTIFPGTGLSAPTASNKIVITGHLGNIGSRLFAHLREKGWIVVGVDKKNGAEHDLAFDGMPWEDNFQRAFAVIHLAATAGVNAPNWAYWHDNYVGMRNVVAACVRQQVPRLIFASTTWVNPRCYGRPTPHEISEYGKSKLYGEQLVREFASPTRCGVSIRVGWAPKPGTPRADDFAESIRNDTPMLMAAFDDALALPAHGYQLTELAKPVGDCG